MLTLLATLAIAGPKVTIQADIPEAEHAFAVDALDYVLPGEGAECDAMPGLREVSKGKASLALVEVNAAEVRFAGRPVVELEGGLFRGADVRGLRVPALLTQAHRQVESARDAASRCPQTYGPFRGAVLVAISREVPFTTVAKVLYSLGQAEFTSFHFLAADRSTRPHPGFDYRPMERPSDVRIYADRPVERMRLSQDEELGCAVISVGHTVSWALTSKVMDGLARDGARDQILAMTVPGGVPRPSVSRSVVTHKLKLKAPLPVFLSNAPKLLPQGSDPHPCLGKEAVLGVDAPVAGGLMGGASGAGRHPGPLGGLGRGSGHGSFGGSSNQFGASQLAFRVEEAQVVGALHASLVQQVLKRHRTKLSRCYAAQIETHPDVEGVVTHRFEIDAQGRVSAAAYDGEAEASPTATSIAACQKDAFLGMRFPSPKDSQPVAVRVQVRFGGGVP